MNPKSFAGKICVITGGSSGIGLALARALRLQGAHLTLIARDPGKLEAAKQALMSFPAQDAKLQVISADVAQPGQIASAIDSIGRQHGRIDLLINSAGIGVCGRFTDIPAAELENAMQINYLGAVYASQAAWPWLRKARGRLSFVSSVAGYLGLYGYTGYAPTKFAITGLAECLRMEGRDDGIHVSIIYPPDTDTPMLAWEQEHTLPECKALSGKIKPKSADEVAGKYLAGLKQNQFEIYCDSSSRIWRFLKNNFPGPLHHIGMRIIKRSRR